MAVLITVVSKVPRKIWAQVGCPLAMCKMHEQIIQDNATNFEHKNQIQVIPLTDFVIRFLFV